MTFTQEPGKQTPSSVDIVLNGEILPGHQRDVVARALSKLFKTTEDKAASLLAGQETVIKRNLPFADADRYLAALKQAGAGARCKPVPDEPAPTPQPFVPPAGDAKRPDPQPAAENGLSLVPIAAESEPDPKPEPDSKPENAIPSSYSGNFHGSTSSPSRTSPVSSDRVRETFADPPPVVATSVEGRIGRLRFIAYQWPAIGAVALGSLFIAFNRFLGMVVFLPALVLSLWIMARSMAMRLHDFNRTGKWVIALWLLPGFAKMLVPGIVGAILFFWLPILIIAVWPGSTGENDYGPPCAPSTFLVRTGAFAYVFLITLGLIVTIAKAVK